MHRTQIFSHQIAAAEIDKDQLCSTRKVVKSLMNNLDREDGRTENMNKGQRSIEG